MTLMSDEFKLSATNFVPVRLELVKGDELLKRWKIPQFPGLRILNADGAVLATPQDRTVTAFEETLVVARKVEKDWKKALSAADLSNPEVRADFVSRHLKRADVDSAVALYRGFSSGDGTEARFASLENVCKALTARNRLAEVAPLIEAADALYTGEHYAFRLNELRLGTFKQRLEKAYLEKNRDLCWKILDEIAEKFPESELAKKKEEHKKWIETHPPETTDRGE
ncbi:hypothetical protein HY251_17910 [bacterium]|nr:hypothetical protein [bacterium]